MSLKSSLRVRLIAWFVAVAAVLVLVVSTLAFAIVFEIAANEARQSLNVAANEVPPLIVAYLEKHLEWNGVQPYLLQKLAPLGVVAHVGPGIRDYLGNGVPREFPPYTLFGAQAEDARNSSVTLRLTAPANVWPPDAQGAPLAREGFGVRSSPGERGPSGEPGNHARLPLFMLMAARVQPQRVRFADREIMLFADPSRFGSMLVRAGEAIGILALLAMLVAWRMAIVAARHTLDPLVRTTNALNRFGEGDFMDEPVKTDDQTELGNLARAYNRAVAQIACAFDERSKTTAEMRQFVADAGHQLRTPLTVIMGHLSGLAGKTSNERDARVVASMLDHSRRMKILIDDLITLAKLEDGEALTTAPIDANELCARVAASFEEAHPGQIEFTPATSSARIAGSPSELFAAISELVENALKYAPNSPVELAVVNQRNRCAISVSDRGPGMTAEELEKAFDRFFRGENGYGVEGTGLGLAIVRRAVQRAGGTTLLVNRRDGGVRCTIAFPLVPSPRDAQSGACAPGILTLVTGNQERD